MAFIFSAAALNYPGHDGNEERAKHRRYKYSIIAISSGDVVSQRKFKNLHVAKVCLRPHKWGFLLRKARNGSKQLTVFPQAGHMCTTSF
jgi:hypothetical protein